MWFLLLIFWEIPNFAASSGIYFGYPCSLRCPHRCEKVGTRCLKFYIMLCTKEKLFPMPAAACYGALIITSSLPETPKWWFRQPLQLQWFQQQTSRPCPCLCKGPNNCLLYPLQDWMTHGNSSYLGQPLGWVTIPCRKAWSSPWHRV